MYPEETRIGSEMPRSKFIIVAVDGGAAAGKSSSARAIAERCNLMHVDSGSHYRAVTLNHTLPTGPELRAPEVTAMVSHFAAMPKVRDILLLYQRSHAQTARENGFAGMIMEGRDIGTVVFPDADFKFFLSADSATREARRAREGVQDSIAKRDKMDAGRKVAPLACADDAVRIDSSNLSLEEVIDKISAIIEGQSS